MKSRQYASNPFTELVKKLSFFFLSTIQVNNSGIKRWTQNWIPLHTWLCFQSCVCMYALTACMAGTLRQTSTSCYHPRLALTLPLYACSMLSQFHCLYCWGTARKGLKVSTSPMTSVRFRSRNTIWSPACIYIYQKNVGINHNPFLTFLSDLNPLCGFTAVTTWKIIVQHCIYINLPGKNEACWRFCAHENLQPEAFQRWASCSKYMYIHIHYLVLPGPCFHAYHTTSNHL